MFYGREQDLAALSREYQSARGSLIVIYGRRRVGKSSLVKHFARKLKCLSFEGLEKEPTNVQIEHFSKELKEQLKENKLLQKASFNHWNDVFDFLSDYFAKRNSKKRIVFFLDEFQWMAAGQYRLVSLIKYYWDKHWKDQNVMLILCGSVASFMVKKVIKSRALYGRITLTLKVDKLFPDEVRRMLGKRSQMEVLRYLLILGGVPKYLELIDQSKSFEQNISLLFFHKHALLNGEFEKIFYSHFREPQFYLSIINVLLDTPMTLADLSKKLRVSSGGGLTGYLQNLELADFVRLDLPFLSSEKTKVRKYRVVDEFLVFYAKYIKPNSRGIKNGMGENLFSRIIGKWDAWLGFTFESFCLKNALRIAAAMGFEDQVLSYSPLFNREPGYQIDLLYERADRVITMCEIKFQSKPVSTSVIPEVTRRAKYLELPKGYSLEYALISPSGADSALKAAEFFHHIVELKDLF